MAQPMDIVNIAFLLCFQRENLHMWTYGACPDVAQNSEGSALPGSSRVDKG